MPSAPCALRFALCARPARRGHTLPELLVVLIILSLFALLALPRFAAGLFRTRMDAAVEAMRGDLQFARARAVSTGLRHQVALNTETRELLVIPYRPEAAGSAATAEGVTAPVLADRLPEEIQITEWSVSPLGYGQAVAAGQAGAGPLTFYPEGNADGLLLILEDTQGSRRGLSVEPFTGEVRELSEEELPR